MREIKFRAWDTLYKCWFNGFYVDWQSGEVSWKLADGTNAGKAENIVLMQYTGLKDKNGVEIYEGDILNLGEVGYAKAEVVIFDRGSFGIKASWITRESQDPFIELNNYCNIIFRNCVEVIGNIYENPELVRDE